MSLTLPCSFMKQRINMSCIYVSPLTLMHICCTKTNPLRQNDGMSFCVARHNMNCLAHLLILIIAFLNKMYLIVCIVLQHQRVSENAEAQVDGTT